ncbi:CLUMA_CG008677, isoform A [Clunio marinus]|uniref:CLUMA_CG008677, isoform A n=1 Tax=Clunio marinus TaxID=568069 RepID=A0A1J1I6J3_9DIPT|nr:CLUMA_CG008677, isoform A [Clunio marinus]
MSFKSLQVYFNGQSRCENELGKLLNASYESEKWAQDVLSFWGDPSKALLNSSWFDFGQFNDCIGYQHESFRGKYCIARFLPAKVKSNKVNLEDSHPIWTSLAKITKDFKSGLCVPSVCKEDELHKIGKDLINQHDVQLGNVQCYAPYTFTKIDYVFIELKTLNKDPAIIRCIDGIKVLTAVWIIIGHRNDMITQLFGDKAIMPNRNLWESTINNFITRYFRAVDTFLACSAILTVQTFLKLLDRGNFNLLKTIFIRYLRFLPLLSFLMMFSISNLPHILTSGPMFFLNRTRSTGCSRTWWSSLLFIQNFVHAEYSCMNYAWYLAVDLQLFASATVFAYLLWAFGKRSLIIIILVIFSVQYSIFSMIENNTLISVFRYKQPQYRLGEYLVGIAFGYLIYTSNGKKLRLGKFITLSCWILSLGFIGIHTFTRIWWTSNSTINHILQATNVEAWTCSISWIVFACHVLKSGSIIRKIFSSMFWQPLSKLCLSIYLIHFKYLELTDFNQKIVYKLSVLSSSS